jgi:hypothetical protein
MNVQYKLYHGKCIKIKKIYSSLRKSLNFTLKTSKYCQFSLSTTNETLHVFRRLFLSLNTAIRIAYVGPVCHPWSLYKITITYDNQLKCNYTLYLSLIRG